MMMFSSLKLVILGAGHVGSHCGMALAWRRVCDEIVLVDILEEKAVAQADDISDSLSFLPSAPTVRAGSVADCADADIVVIAIGASCQPGETRLDLLPISIRALQELMAQLKALPLSGLVITITNPADIVADYVRRALGLPRERCFGTGTLLDTGRLIRILSEETGVARGSIFAFSMGEHGDSSMIPYSQIRLGGLPMDAFPQVDRNGILRLTRSRGTDIIAGKGSTEFGIGQALAHLCRCILEDGKQVLPLSVQLQGEYGQSGLHCGVPCRVGRKGIEAIIPLSLTGEERAQFNQSCAVIKQHIAMAEGIASPGS